ncbi:hypothetical protein Micbo1qcDRAFT_166490 [Microdochium bolleyi]|uniref:Uncharacterized protein n=1 Tax=Microdochium bolleyi TaxID=196109 RepID=A0A136IUD2_9PEZI|nr:hypothetical protein Micbo1qcDRAFT_166490 [Microdochium bolleyi]
MPGRQTSARATRNHMPAMLAASRSGPWDRQRPSGAVTDCASGPRGQERPACLEGSAASTRGRGGWLLRGETWQHGQPSLPSLVPGYVVVVVVGVARKTKRQCPERAKSALERLRGIRRVRGRSPERERPSTNKYRRLPRWLGTETL